MARLLIRNIDDRVKAQFKRRALKNGRSMGCEARELLSNSLQIKTKPKTGFGTATRNVKHFEEIKQSVVNPWNAWVNPWFVSAFP